MIQHTTASPKGSPTKGTDAQKQQNSESDDEASTKAPSQRFTKLKKLKVTIQDEESLDDESSDEEEEESQKSALFFRT